MRYWAHKCFEMATTSEEPMCNVIAISTTDIGAYILYKKYTYVLYI